jgi:RNA-directed DNA polymerase
MTKAPISLQELRRRIYRKAKSDKTYRFWGIFVHITKPETLEETYRAAKRDGGAPGLDGHEFLASVREELITGRYKSKPNRRVDIGYFATRYMSANWQ